MADVLVDTDILVDHLRGAHRLVAGAHAIHYSVVTRAELFAGRATDEGRVGMLLDPFRELAVSRSIAETAGRLRRDQGVALADAVIAATALEHGLELWTRNLRHFERIPGLTPRRPHAGRSPSSG